MLKSLEKMSNIKTKNDIDKLNDSWLYYLYVTSESNYNRGHLKSLSELSNKSVLNYVVRCLNVLNEEAHAIDDESLFYVEEALKWMEVAKCGTKTKRREWTSKHHDLSVHNIGSAQIYRDDLKNNSNEIVEVLIKTHGLIGQYIKGEVNLDKNQDLYNLIEQEKITKEKLKTVLYVLNKAIIMPLSTNLWNRIEKEVKEIIDIIVNNDFRKIDCYDPNYIINRLLKLQPKRPFIEKENLNQFLEEPFIKNSIGEIFEKLELWFVDSAFFDFSFEEIIKVFLIIDKELENKDNFEHLSFENVMKTIYLDYNGKKVINIYKRRIIEHFLKSITFDDIVNSNINNKHIEPKLEFENHTILFSFDFSIQAVKLIEFCEIAYGTDSIFNKAVFMLYDLFGFRRDQYDRFYNEIDYLKTMNESLSKKAKILDYITGKNILDVGPGGGALMDLIIEEMPDANVMGIDISSNVIEELNRKKELENKKWNVIKGDALKLTDYIEKNQIDTVIYSSIIHELFSYIETDGKKFNQDTIKLSLKEAFEILPSKGRIIIRDGIMTEDKTMKRIIKFKNREDIKILDRYCNDFEGRTVTYEKISSDEVMMYVNDAMEFLYTYTWGENSYSHEVKEQFGYFTPLEYTEFIKKIFGDNAQIIEFLHFLQDGYEDHLLEKIDFYDESYNRVPLPDSTCIIAIEKK